MGQPFRCEPQIDDCDAVDRLLYTCRARDMIVRVECESNVERCSQMASKFGCWSRMELRFCSDVSLQVPKTTNDIGNNTGYLQLEFGWKCALESNRVELD